MAEDAKQQTHETVQDQDEKKLEHLEFVQVAAIYIVVCFSSLYEYAKENSGPLKSGVQTVEGTVKTVIRPVYEKFHDVPFKFLKFLDRKVDETLTELDKHVPSLVKQAGNQAKAVASEVHRVGVVDAAKSITRSALAKYEPTARELYESYEPVAEQYAVSAWRTLNRLPLFPQVAAIAVPTAAYWSEKYNHVVSYTEERGYTVASYLPTIPIEKIAKIFEEGHNGGPVTVSTNGKSVMAE